jgi:hypothetical protein
LLDHTAEFATFTGGAGGYTYYFWARNETGTGTQITLCALREGQVRRKGMKVIKRPAQRAGLPMLGLIRSSSTEG